MAIDIMALIFVTSIISAIISYLAGMVFFLSYAKEKKSNRLIWGLAFILYAIGHTIMGVVAAINLPAIDMEAYKLWIWVYVNVSGAGTTGLILYSTVPFVTEKQKIRELLTGIFMGLYVGVSALFAFVLPDENALAFINPVAHTQYNNMSWWVVECLIPASFFIGIVFIRHFKVSGTVWGLLIGLSFIIYAIILFIWPITDLKPIFYIVRCISVGFLCIGGILLARD